MAILLSVRAESDLLCLLQSHPPQPAGGHVGQGLQHHFQSLRPLLMDIHGHHTSEHRELSLAARQPIRITASHSPIDLRASQCRTLGFICSLAGCKLSHSIEFYMGCGPVLPLIQIRGTTVVILCFCIVTSER